MPKHRELILFQKVIQGQMIINFLFLERYTMENNPKRNNNTF
jgi:hypothetical protein